MKVGIMQPYFLPYLGYFQLIKAVDKFIVYDDVQYIKGGWINRNRLLINNKPSNFILSLKNDSYKLNINERYFSEKIDYDVEKLLKGIDMSYKKAPYYNEVIFIIRKIFCFDLSKNISEFILNSLITICDYLNIKTEIIKSSEIKKEHGLKGQSKLIDIVKRVEGNMYINSIGGRELYSKNVFGLYNIDLKFIKTNNIEYKQYDHEFIPNLSILDVLMFNSKEKINVFLNQYELI